MTSFQDLRQRRHAQWLTELKQQIKAIVESQAKPPLTDLSVRFTGPWGLGRPL